jgi:serine/threonine protein kinase
MAANAQYRNALPIGTQLLEYRVDAVLGAGGFGITYLCHDTHLDKRVAIKEYFPTDLAVRALDGGVITVNSESDESYKWGLERFIQEARTLAKFSHPHIVRVNRYFEANTTGYMVMDYEDGNSLHQMLVKATLEEGALLQMLRPLLDGLRAVHHTGFLHRDIKPSNIFIRGDGNAVLIDFGSARQAAGGPTKTLTSVLTPGFAPLEQYSGDGHQGPWTDIYAMGGVLYRVFSGENPPDAVSRLRNDPVPAKLAALRGHVSGASLQAVQWALVLDEKSRPQNVDEWRGVLDGIAPARMPRANPPARPSSAAAGTPTRVATTTSSTNLPTRVTTGAALPAPRQGHIPANDVPTTRVIRVRPEPEGGSIWRWIGVGAIALMVLGLGNSWYKRHLAKEQAAQLAVQEARLARERAAAEAAADARAAAADAEHRARDQLRLAERDAALKQLDETHARELAAQKPAIATVPTPVVALPATLMPQVKVPVPSATLEEARARDPLAVQKEMDFRRADSNGDGYLSPDEARNMPGLATDFRRADTNADGRISLDEFFNYRPSSGGEAGGGGFIGGLPGVPSGPPFALGGPPAGIGAGPGGPAGPPGAGRRGK